jgi:hypothetical protein
LAQVGELSAATEASRAMVRLMPKAKLSSLPLNHLASAVVTATIIDSAPNPSTVRPAIITTALPLAAVSRAPSKQSVANIAIAFLVPIRSIRIPPISNVATAATL